MKVTNEQAEAVKNCINGRPDIYANGINIPADWFASDLLESRAQNAELLAALRHYAEENKYFPRGVIIECQAKEISLAEIYSDFGETARAAIAKHEKSE